MKRNILVGIISGIALLCAGCSVSRKTTTTITPVEQALMTRSASLTLRSVEMRGFEGRKFHIDSSELVSPYKEAIISLTRQQLLEHGMLEADGEESADVTVYTRADYSGVDDSEVFIGVPAVPVPVPGVGTLATPELALYKRVSQLGRNKIAFYGVRRDDGSLEFVAEPDPAQRYYVRYTLFFFISFRTTDLDKPF